jgi:hypothetical protein
MDIEWTVLKEVLMFNRVQMALATAFVAVFLTSMTASAKGGFDFITITGPDLKEAVQVNDPALTRDFFTFANFYEDKAKAPADPSKGYEITRHYVQGASNVVFDRLHYYPESGFVFYDGIENGESEYDGEWYLANPEIRSIFETALTAQLGSVAQTERKQPGTSSQPPAARARPVISSFPSLFVVIAILAVGLAALSAFVFLRRKPSAQ